MKKIYLVLAAIVLLVFTACSNNQTKGNNVMQKVDNSGMEEMVNYPAWVLDPSIEDGIGAVGSAKIGAAGVSFARQEALAQARDELARQIEVKVNNMFKSYTNAIGLAGEDGVEKIATNVSKQVASQTLRGTKQKELWISPDKELFVQVVLPNEILVDEAKNAFKNETPIGNSDRALWQEFKSEKAQKQLDYEIEKMVNNQ
ncbi:LPP20 lipoprotein [Hypnocyclicus thermotrophus]|uniref:LPP20 lipoprotein n=1 Tax=Hypnocyclicus thermotrophus TaxID=1627895 RepID=A0AA46DZS0_9FUSO|nr:LPP20 family lipoprotein [Hypnocyclicus thermotrophus]TDT71929.1 LPP20 lipoprotein [Hypnocyclicus thermotrophus]